MKKLLTLLWGILIFHSLKPQAFGIQLGIGTSHFLGDLGGKPTYGTNDPSDLDFGTTRYVATAGFRINVSPTFCIQANRCLWAIGR